MYEQYKDRVEFFIVYIVEAHSSDVWQMTSNVRQNVVFTSPRNFDERTSIAQSCVRNLHLPIPRCSMISQEHGKGLYWMARPALRNRPQRTCGVQKYARPFWFQAGRDGSGARAALKPLERSFSANWMMRAAFSVELTWPPDEVLMVRRRARRKSGD